MANFFSKKSKSDDVAEQNSGADYDPSKARLEKRGGVCIYKRGNSQNY